MRKLKEYLKDKTVVTEKRKVSDTERRLKKEREAKYGKKENKDLKKTK